MPSGTSSRRRRWVGAEIVEGAWDGVAIEIAVMHLQAAGDVASFLGDDAAGVARTLLTAVTSPGSSAA